MKAILIDPAEHSIETIDVIPGSTPQALMQLHDIVGDHLDFAYIAPGESIAVGDESALANPPLPSFRIEGSNCRLYGRGVVLGFGAGGKERDTRFTPEELSKLITWYD